MSLLSTEIAEKFNKDYCSDTTSSQHFWVWDPTDPSPEPKSHDETARKRYCHLLLSPNKSQRDQSLEVKTNFDAEKTIVSVDKCLILDKIPTRRCDALLIHQNDRELIWIELKLNLKTKNTNPSNLRSALFGDEVGEGFGGAFEQIVETKLFFEEKGINFEGRKNKGFVAIPKKLMLSKIISQELPDQRVTFKIRHKFNVDVGCILLLDKK